MLEELQSLAALASFEPEITVTRGEAGCPWSFNWERRVITANPEDLELRPPDYCRGLILHESAHAAITRVDRIVPSEWLGKLHPLLNAIEDCRIETWLQARFEGCRPWIRLYNDHLFSRSTEAAQQRVSTDPAAAFMSGILDRWWNPNPVMCLQPLAAEALDRIWPHFVNAVAAHPPARAAVPPALLGTYAAHPVSLCYRAADREAPPSAAECEIRICQHQMWLITWRHIVPEFLRLLEHPDSEPTRQHIREMQRRAAAQGSAAGTSSSGRSSRPGSGGARLSVGEASAYGSARARHSALIESCSQVLLRFLTAESRAKTTRFHRSGQRLDLRVAMQFEANPRLYDQLWQRVSLPLHPDPAFVVAIDASGSMSGDKADATFDALVILRETCLRLGIPLAIIAFNNDATILQSIDNPRAASVESRLAGLLKPDGGTNLSSALSLASRILTQCPQRHRHLWVLSDGETYKPQDARQLLRAIRSDGTRIHGLGLGPGSGEIATLIPQSPTHLQPSQLPGVFAQLLQGTVSTCADTQRF